MKKFISLLILTGFCWSLLYLSPVKAEKNSQAEDKGPLSKITFLHYKKEAAKSGGGIKGPSVSCYGYIVSGAKWKTPKNYIVNPSGSGLDGAFVQQAIDKSVAQWEQFGANIFGTGSTDSAFPYIGMNNDNKNVVSFGPYSDNNVIAVTSLWGYFSGSPSTREIIEWDILFNSSYRWGDSTVNGSSVMDVQNIATHELGHGAGLADLYNTSCSPESMFGYSSYGETLKRDLNTGDIQGIQRLYR